MSDLPPDTGGYEVIEPPPPAKRLDPRWARLLSLDPGASREQLAHRVAEMAGFDEPTRPETIDYLADLALIVQHMLDDYSGQTVELVSATYNINPRRDPVTTAICATDLGLLGHLSPEWIVGEERVGPECTLLGLVRMRFDMYMDHAAHLLGALMWEAGYFNVS